MYNKIIHIEGIDRVGKTTLKEYIVKQTQGKYLVYDRSFISQIAYGRIYKRNINENFFWEKFQNAFCHDDIFVYLYCNEEIIKHRILDTDEKHIHKDSILKHQYIFNEVVIEASSQGINLIKINVSDLSTEQVYLKVQKEIINNAINNCSACKFCLLDVNQKDIETGTGKLIPNIIADQPKYLIVGMNPSINRIKNTEHPFAINDSNDKNKAFIDILNKYNIFNQAVITNAVKCSSTSNKIDMKDFNACKHHLEAEIEVFKPKYIICLGKQIGDFLRSSLIAGEAEIIDIYHPAYQYAYNKISVEDYDKHIYNQVKHTL